MANNWHYDKFNMQLGDTLINPHFGDDKPFDAIVANPPYSVKWLGYIPLQGKKFSITIGMV